MVGGEDVRAVSVIGIISNLPTLRKSESQRSAYFRPVKIAPEYAGIGKLVQCVGLRTRHRKGRLHSRKVRVAVTA
jgi:hypothetical protein